MSLNNRGLFVFSLVIVVFSLLNCPTTPKAADSKLEFFEKRIRPVLIEQCYECHNSAKSPQGGVALDSRDGFLKGGNGGKVLVPGKPDQSRLLSILRHDLEGLKMPQGGAKLEPRAIEDFQKWIAEGAIDPRDNPPSGKDLEMVLSWESVRNRRAKWWSFQPVRPVTPPVVNTPGASSHPVDRFILSRLERQGLSPSPRADKRSLLRRTSFLLTGLPPSEEELARFIQDSSPDAFEKQVDRFLASPRFGENWARHWMDLVRYCESHGSQGDPELPNAWRYRDYLIRALNDDLPYDQFVKEQIAGDLLPNPRIHPVEGWNESAIGPAHFRMVEYGFVPVDALEDQVKVVDNQIDVLSKTFLGLTISCARCHDHKFDPISQKDFYSLYGILASSRPWQVPLESPDRLTKNYDTLKAGKNQIRHRLADAWLKAVPSLLTELKGFDTLAKEKRELDQSLNQLRVEIESLERPARETILKTQGKPNNSNVPRPLARWNFNNNLQDSEGNLHGSIEGKAVYRNGRLILNGKDVRVRTGPITREIREKTLEAWVSLANLDQRGTGVISLESDEGDKFDSIVFSEIDKGVWIAGSDYFNRTQPNGGAPETAGPNKIIHLAIVYKKDKTISIYRDGKPYGTTFSKGPLQPFPAGKGRLLFGQRHPGPTISYLDGELDEARLYDRALTSEEISESFTRGPDEITRQDLLKVLSPSDRKRLEDLLAKQMVLERKSQALETVQKPLQKVMEEARTTPSSPFHAWVKLQFQNPLAKNPLEWTQHWNDLVQTSNKDWESRNQNHKKLFQPGWDLTRGDDRKWFHAGVGLQPGVSHGGEFSLEREGEKFIKGIYPPGVYSHGLSRKHTGILTSPRFTITTDYVSIHAAGENSGARLVIENYALGNGGIYPATRLNQNQMGWIRFDTAYRKGSQAYVELTTDENDKAFFGIDQVVFHNAPETPKELTIPSRAMLPCEIPTSVDQLVRIYQDTFNRTIQAFRMGNMTPEEAAFLDYFVRNDLLPNGISQISDIRTEVETYRAREKEVVLSRRVPGFQEAGGFAQPLFKKGRHTQPSDPVPHRYLELFGAKQFGNLGSDRLALALEIASPNNPLTYRVMVNRLWYHLFGKGLVGTVDNFGRLGDQPTHPELLDYLTVRFLQEDKGSIKKMLRFLLTSSTFQQSTQTSEEAMKKDPENRLLSHMPVRRLEAESIRDAILATSGQLDLKMFGPGINVYFVSKTEGGGPKGPLDGDRRRSVYQRIRRNASNPFLEVFDAPKPSTTRGKRDSTNVPAQSLTMLNDPFVIDQAGKWAKVLVQDGRDMDSRIQGMFQKALNRPPSPTESKETRAFCMDLAAHHGVATMDMLKSEILWRDMAQSIFCLKEFIYVD